MATVVSSKLTTRVDPVDGRERIAIEAKEGISIDIVAEDGSLLARINAFDFGKGCGNIDVILDPKAQRGCFLSWLDGKPVTRQPTPVGTSVHAVSITKQ